MPARLGPPSALAAERCYSVAMLRAPSGGCRCLRAVGCTRVLIASHRVRPARPDRAGRGARGQARAPSLRRPVRRARGGRKLGAHACVPPSPPGPAAY
eukprot:10796482-Lingulodinium_polyedra.AAC.1